ncbi:hypothetical protein Btru_066931 [Bulinus truncatus]|nr:hypothetical protein Btru_066931 [Bulinus truncatus]
MDWTHRGLIGVEDTGGKCVLRWNQGRCHFVVHVTVSSFSPRPSHRNGVRMSPQQLTLCLLVYLTTTAVVFSFRGVDEGGSPWAKDGSDGKDVVLVVIADGLDRNTGLCNVTVDQSTLGSLMNVFVDTVNRVMNRAALAVVEGPCNKMTDLGQRTLDAVRRHSVTAVVTATSNLTSDRFLDVFDLLGVRVVELVTGDVILKRSRRLSHIVVPHPAYWDLQFALSEMTKLNWTMAALGSAASSSTAAETLFAAMAIEQGLCLLPASLDRKVPEIKISEFDGIISVSAYLADVELQARHFDARGNKSLNDSVPAKQELLSFDRLDKNSTQTLLTLLSSHCVNRTLNIGMCLVYKRWPSLPYRVLSEFNDIINSVSLFCNEAELKGKCSPSESDSCVLQGLLRGNATPNVYRMLRPVKDHDKGSNRRTTRDTLEHVQIHHDQMRPSANFSASVSYTSCGSYCHLCWRCSPLRSSSRRVLKSGEGTLAIVGLFPLTKHSGSGPCSRPSTLGRAAADAFLNTLMSSDDPSSGAGHGSNLTIQGLVIDTCVPRDAFENIVGDVESCGYTYANFESEFKSQVLVQPSLVAGYVRAFSHVTPSAASKPAVTVTSTGYSATSDPGLIFAEKAMTALKGIGWTVMTVIMSDQEPFSSALRWIKSSRLSVEFCFIECIVLSSNSSSRSTDLNRIRTATDKTALVLLLTNARDTVAAIQHLRSSWAITRRKASLILTPWNDVPLHGEDVFTFIDVVVSLRPALGGPVVPSNIVFGSGGGPVDETNSGHSLSDKRVLHLVALAAGEIKSYVEGRGLNLTSSERIDSTEIEVVEISTDSRQGNVVAKVDQGLTWVRPFSGPSFTRCRGWCPLCQSCKGDNPSIISSPYIPGDLIVTAVLPLRKRAPSGVFQCGEPNDDPTTLLVTLAFMFAVETARDRYPDLLPRVKVGGLVLDSCSDVNIATKVIGDFEMCSAKFGNADSDLPSIHEKMGKNGSSYAYPSQNVGYMVDSQSLGLDRAKRILESAKTRQAIFLERDVGVTQENADREQVVDAVTEVMVKLKWKKVVVLFEGSRVHQNEADLLLKEFFKEKICVVAALKFKAENVSHIEGQLIGRMNVPIVLLSSVSSSVSLLKSIQKKSIHFWIIPATSHSEADLQFLTSMVQAGSILITRKYSRNEEFNAFLKDMNRTDSNPPQWYREILKNRYSCSLKKGNNCQSFLLGEELTHLSPIVHDTVKHVDALLHGLHRQYVRRCPDQRGICDTLAEDLVSGSLPPLLKDVSFVFQGELLEYVSSEQIIHKLSLFNKHDNKLVEVGKYVKGDLHLNTSSIHLYNSVGVELSHIPEVRCRNDCACLDIFPRNLSLRADDHGDHSYSTRPGEFIMETWSIAVVAVSSSGCFVSLIFAVYVMHKMCTGTIGRRYTVLGLALLLAVTVLYGAVLPFVFEPSETVCAMRYFLTGLAYTFCFAVILVKLMTLQSYKFIGLGGEVSGLNQAATVFFITCVQVSSGVHWWLYYSPFLRSRLTDGGVLNYACNMDRIDFAIYLVYTMFLLAACCLYSVGVRNEKKNMGEARLLLFCSWLCLFVWVGWLSGFFFFDRKWSNVLICGAILACATAVMLIVFIPKVRLVSRLKYDLSSQASTANARNGYCIDTDFLYERPQSLPGTLTSTVSSSGKSSCAKTVTSFDSDLKR